MNNKLRDSELRHVVGGATQSTFPGGDGGTFVSTVIDVISGWINGKK